MDEAQRAASTAQRPRRPPHAPLSPRLPLYHGVLLCPPLSLLRRPTRRTGRAGRAGRDRQQRTGQRVGGLRQRGREAAAHVAERPCAADAPANGSSGRQPCEVRAQEQPCRAALDARAALPRIAHGRAQRADLPGRHERRRLGGGRRGRGRGRERVREQQACRDRPGARGGARGGARAREARGEGEDSRGGLREQRALCSGLGRARGDPPPAAARSRSPVDAARV